VSIARDLQGPLDAVDWPAKLAARVVSPGVRPTLHGYDFEEDLARHYSFAEVVLLALTGEPPSPEVGRAFEVALVFASPVPVSEAPSHAAVVARACASSVNQIQSVAAIALSEQTRVSLEQHRGWLDALSASLPAELPDLWRARSDDERASVSRLRLALRGTIDVPALALDVGLVAALIATLHACGIRSSERVECALTWARLPIAMAEALATKPGSHLQYPVMLPDIVYTEGES
jgi:hypothetical protein